MAADGEIRAIDTTALRKRCRARVAALKSERELWMSDWQQVSEYIDPIRGRFDRSRTPNSPAKRSRKKIINDTATRALRTMAAGMMSHMTSKSRPWFRLTLADNAMAEMADVRVWLDLVGNIVRDTLAKSNFYKAMPVVYTEDGMFGISAMLVLEHPTEVVGFYPLTCGTYAIGLNDQQQVDTLWRCYTRTAKQLEERYGQEKLPQPVKDALRNDRVDQVFEVQSLFEPNPDARPGMGPLGLQAAPYRAYREVVWMDCGNDTDGVLHIGGHYEFPAVVIRWNPVGGDVYSTSPALDALGDIKQLQYLEGKKLELIDLQATPPLGLPDSLRNTGEGSLRPGAKTYLPATAGREAATPLYTPDPRAVQMLAAEIREVEARIQDAFFYNLFLMLATLDDRDRTATEIAERREEKAAVLGPSLEAVTDEGLDPIVIRTYKILERAGRLPPPPEALDGAPIKIEYTSILAQAAKAHGTASIERVLNFAGAAAGLVGPAVLDKLDPDQMIDEYADRVGVPVSVIRSDEAVEETRQARQQQEQMQQLAMMAQPAAQGAQAVKALAEAGAVTQQTVGAG